MRLSLILMLTVATTGCAWDSLGLNDDDDHGEVMLAPGVSKMIGDAYRILFAEVKNDSRCAVDVVCVWAGDATVEIGLWVGTGPTHPFTLHLSGTPRSVTFAGYEITFLALSPEPRSDRVIRPEDYRARFRVRAQPSALATGR